MTAAKICRTPDAVVVAMYYFPSPKEPLIGFMKIRLLLLILLHIFFQCRFHAFARQYTFKNYTVAHGLGSPSVNHIFQDSRGYIWFATQGGGASRFNGSKFENFTKADGLINNDVTYIAEDSSGNIWIGTAGGASRFDGTSFRSFSAADGLTDAVVYSIHTGEHGKIWFATSDAGIRIFDGARFVPLATEDTLASKCAFSIVQDSAKNWWFGLSDGIAKYSDGRITSYFASEDDNDTSFFSALLDSSGNIWFGSTRGKVVVISHDAIRNFELPQALQNDFIGGMAQDKRGGIWFATDHGLLKYDENKFNLFSEREGFSVNSAQAVMCDYEGNIWAGTLDGGVNLLSSEAFVCYTDDEGLTSAKVMCIHPEGASYYIGTGDGVYVFNPEDSLPFNKISGIEDVQGSISSISVDRQGLVWLCTLTDIVVIEKKNNGFMLRAKHKQIDGKDIISPVKIIHDTKGNCWIAAYGSGLFLLNSRAQISFNMGTCFPSDNILTVFEDSRSNIWIGTYDAGVIQFDGKNFNSIWTNDSLTDNSVWSLAEDNKGNVYWGTGESGLFRYNNGTITSYAGNDLRSESIKSLAWDEHGNCLWLASETKLKKIAFTADYQIEAIREYKEEDGFGSAGVNHDALRVDDRGNVWLGSVNGLWRFNHHDDLPNQVPPKIRLTGIRLFYQNTDWNKFSDSIDHRSGLPLSLQLPHSKNHLTFDIQALTTQEARYAFMLEGQDEQWAAPGTNNEITYSNISPGKYVFKAMAVNSAGIASNDNVAFTFSILPPWWGTWWFRAAAFAAVIGLLAVFIKAREKILREQNIRLEETVKLRTSEIANQKEVIENTLSEKEGLLHEKEILLKEIHHRVKNNLQTISSMLMLQSAGLTDEAAKAAIAESQSRVRSIALVHQKLYQTDGLEKVEMNSFVKDLTVQVRSLYHQRARQVGIHCDIPETYILIDTAIPLGLILNELLTNSFKYAFNKTEKGEIRIDLENLSANANSPKTKKVKLTYRDNGPGFDFAALNSGASTLGIRLVNLLSQQIGATLAYSRSGGSEFIFIFELNA